jgi:hypothetical protein
VQHFQVTKITKKSSLVNQFNHEQIKTAVGDKINIKLEFWGCLGECAAREDLNLPRLSKNFFLIKKNIDTIFYLPSYLPIWKNRQLREGGQRETN